MRVRVDIDVSDGSTEFVREYSTERTFMDTSAKEYLQAAAILDRIAANIRRMYPEPEREA